jgi:Predicted metal-dependent hydrolase
MRAVPHGGGVALRRARTGWYWNNISLGEHTGTHFDAPIHWITGKDLPNNAVDTIDVRKFIRRPA